MTAFSVIVLYCNRYIALDYRADHASSVGTWTSVNNPGAYRKKNSYYCINTFTKSIRIEIKIPIHLLDYFLSKHSS